MGFLFVCFFNEPSKNAWCKPRKERNRSYIFLPLAEEASWFKRFLTQRSPLYLKSRYPHPAIANDIWVPNISSAFRYSAFRLTQVWLDRIYWGKTKPGTCQPRRVLGNHFPLQEMKTALVQEMSSESLASRHLRAGKEILRWVKGFDTLYPSLQTGGERKQNDALIIPGPAGNLSSMQQGSNQWIRIRELGKIRYIPAYREDEFGLYNKAEVQCVKWSAWTRADWQPKVAKSCRFELAGWTEDPQPRQRLWVGRLWPHFIYWAPYLLIINLWNSSLCYATGKYVRDFNLALWFLLGRDHQISISKVHANNETWWQGRKCFLSHRKWAWER